MLSHSLNIASNDMVDNSYLNRQNASILMDCDENNQDIANTSTFVQCPLAKFGCATKIPRDKLSEHYHSQIHQEILMKEVEIYVRKLHEDVYDAQIDDHSFDTFVSIKYLAQGLDALNDENIQLQSQLTNFRHKIAEQSQSIEESRRSMEETSQILHGINLNTSVFQNEIEAMRDRLQEATINHSSAKDGSFLWKIDNVSQRIADAVSERQISIYSPPFYSSPNGYKMRLRMYMNGDGQARGTHLSLFFVLMRGDYDNLLTWPFQYKVTFVLYDQLNSQRHIIDSFRPDIKSNSFQKPQTDMNIASGIPKFLPLTLIQSEGTPYVRDNCMFIKCLVDFASLPKTVLHYVTTINPGLPFHVQHHMIQSEINRRNVE